MSGIPREIIQKIIEAAANAPSGSNSQPLRFEVRKNEIDIIALPERDHPILNFRNRGTWIAHGALIENIAIAAREFGYSPKIMVFPDTTNKNLTARITLTKTNEPKDSLYPAIASRCTNRKPYATTPLSKIQKEELIRIAERWKQGNISVKFIESKEQIEKIGQAASVNEVIMFENRALHKLLFEEIVWTREEEKKRGKGLLFATMELKPPPLMVKMLRSWSLMRILNMLGVARAIAKDNVKMYAATPMVCAINTGNDDADFINAGRLLERLWLQATSMGLNVHLMTGILFMWQRIASGETGWLSENHVALIREAYQTTASIVQPGGKNVALLFRIGKAENPTARSLKLPPEIGYLSI